MLLIAWIGACVLASVFLRNRCIWLIIACLVIWAAVPGVASSVLTGLQRGGALGFHPASWLIFTTFAVQVVNDIRGILAEIGRRVLVYLALVLFLSVAFLATKTSASGSGLVLFFSQMLAPVLLFLIINITVARNPADLYRLRNWVVGIAAVESVLALIEWSRHGVLLYRSYYQTQYWFDEVRFPRWMGTLDHPLTLSLLLCVAVPLLAGIRIVWVQLPLLIVLSAGMLATQSRTGLAVVGIGVVYVLLTSRIHVVAKAFSVVVLGVAAWFAATSALSSGVADRLASSDGGSADARAAAVNFVLNHVGDFLFTGGGIGSSYGVADSGGLTTSLESSILIYAIDIGVVFSLVYFGTQLVIVLRSFGPSTVPGLALAGLAVVIVPQTYNALGTQTFAGILLWTVLAMAASMTSERSLRRRLEDTRAPSDTDLREEQLRLWSATAPQRIDHPRVAEPESSGGLR